MDTTTFFEERPWTKIQQALAGILVVVLALVIVLAIVGEHLRAKRLVRHQGEVLAETVVASMSESLAAGENDAVKSMFSTLNRSSLDVEVLVFDPEGVVAFATQVEQPGRRVRTLTSSGAVLEAVSHVLANEPLQETSYEETIDDRPWLTMIRPILNAQRCHSCHESSREVLGGIMVRSSTAASNAAIRTARNVNIAVGLVGLAIAILLMRWLLQRVVRSLLADVVAGGEVMASSAADLFGVFQQISSDSEETSGRAESVTGSAKELTSTVGSVAAAMEQTSTSANAIAIATEEMTSSIGEIARETASAS